MKWAKRFTKKNGKFRKHSNKWQIPKEIRIACGLKDRDECEIAITLGEHSYCDIYELMSNGEFTIRGPVADEVESRVKENRALSISFDLSMVLSLEFVERQFASKVKKSSSLPSEKRSKRLSIAPNFPECQKIVTTVFKRNPDVVAEVLVRANGTCKNCGQPAPFHRASDGSPYLEVHPQIRLVDGAEDTVANSIALCPNCHRESHYG